MNKYVLLIVLLLLGAALFAQAAPDTSTVLPVDPDLIIGQLPNGLTYYIKVNHTPAKRAELRLAINIGSVQEDIDQQGLAHFTEHMAFNGTQHFKKSELVDYLNSIGMGYANGLNAATGLDQTVYQLQVPTDNADQFRKGILILSDWAHAVSMDSVEINKERGVIIEEWRMGQGADQRMNDVQRKVMFAGSRYAERMPIGQLDVLQTFKPETLRRFYSDWYRPDLEAVIAVGDFDPKLVEDLIKQYFSAIPKKADERPVVLYPVPDHPEPRVVIASDKEATDTYVQLNWLKPSTYNKTVGDYRNSLVTNLYTQMLNMRLQELAQKPNPPFTAAYNYKGNILRSKSTYALVAITPENGILAGCQALLTEAERVKRFGFTATELDRAKQISLRSAERMLADKDKQDSDRLVWRYVGNFVYGNPLMSVDQNVALNRELYNGISLAEVDALTHELVTDNDLVIEVSAPQKEGLTLPTEAQLLALIPEVRTEELTPYQDEVSQSELLQAALTPGKVTKAKSYPAIGVKSWKLGNGITVLYKKTDFKNDEILCKSYSPGGTSLYDLPDLFEAREAADIILQSGVNGFSASTLEKKLAGKIVDVAPYINSENEGFNASCSPTDLETMFQLIYLYSTAPRLEADDFTGWKDRMTASLQNEALSPETVFMDSLSAFFYDGNPRVRNIKVEDLPNLDRERVLQIYKERFADFSDFTFIFVGNFDETALKAYCAKYLANLPVTGRKETVRDNGVRFTKGIKTFSMLRGQDPRSTVEYCINSPAKIDALTNSRLRNVSFLMDEKLRENIREDRSGVYFVGAWGNTDKYPEPSYQISVFMQCAPERVNELSGAVVATLDSLKAGQFGAKYVNVVKVTRQKQFETDTKENRWWLNNIFDQIWNGFPLDKLLADRKQINKLTLKELQNDAKTFLKQNTNLVTGILYPAQQVQE